LKTESLAEHFHHYFQIKLARSESLLEEVQRLRYRVYCEEFGFEDKSRFPDRREKDEFDDRSYHALILHRATGRAVSTVRLILASDQDRLPFELHCGGSFDIKRVDSMGRETMCEFSRLSVDPQFRRRPGETSSQYGNFKYANLLPEERRLSPFIGISTFLAGTLLPILTGRQNVFAMMESFLENSLKKIGIHFQPLGAPVEYHGRRVLYHMRSESVCLLLKPELKELFLLLHDELKPYFSGRRLEAEDTKRPATL
jgi:N-acyl amino acid synthase of PEP-CTERM/exosortase system